MDIFNLIVKYFLNSDVVFTLIGLFLFLYIIWIKPIIQKNKEYETNIKNTINKIEEDNKDFLKLEENINRIFSLIDDIEKKVDNNNKNDFLLLKKELNTINEIIYKNNKIINDNNAKIDEIYDIVKKIEDIIKLIKNELKSDKFNIKDVLNKIDYIYQLKEERENLDKKLKEIVKIYLNNKTDNKRIDKILDEDNYDIQ